MPPASAPHGQPYVRLDELDPAGTIVELDTVAAAILAETGLVAVTPAGIGRWRLSTRGRVGAVSIPGLSVHVEPAEGVGLSNLMFLLGYIRDPQFLPTAVPARTSGDLWPAMAHALAVLSDTALRKGVLRGYRNSQDSLHTIRGRIRFGEQISRHQGRLLPVEVEYSEHTADIPENRILRSAIARMIRVAGVDAATVGTLLTLDAVLRDASILTPGAPIPRWTPTRMNQRLQAALHLATMVLRGTSAAVESDRQNCTVTASFVATMPEVFAGFIEVAVAEALALRSSGTSERGSLAELSPAEYAQGTERASEFDDIGTGDFLAWTQAQPQVQPQVQGLPPIQPQTPDPLSPEAPGWNPALPPQLQSISVRSGLVHRVDGIPVAVIDAGYPLRGQLGRTPESHYRALAACTALGLSTAWLVRPRSEHLRKPRIYRIVHTQVQIIEYPIAMDGTPQEIIEAVDRLAERIWTVASRELPQRARHARHALNV